MTGHATSGHGDRARRRAVRDGADNMLLRIMKDIAPRIRGVLRDIPDPTDQPTEQPIDQRRPGV